MNESHQAAPGQVPHPWWTRPAPPWLLRLLAAGLAVLVLFLAWNWSSLRVYRKHWFEAHLIPAASVPWDRLSGELDEAAVHRLSGAGLECFDDSTGMGDRSCYSPVKEVNGHQALTLAYFFKSGRLSGAVVHVPWWGHTRATAIMAAKFGPGKLVRVARGEELRRWELSRGNLHMNKHRAINPLEWGAIVWRPGR